MTKPTRVELTRRVPCFHCSKSLQYVTGIKKYVGFSLVDDAGMERVFHRVCADEFQEGLTYVI